jgi:hypothetical protein
MKSLRGVFKKKKKKLLEYVKTKIKRVNILSLKI